MIIAHRGGHPENTIQAFNDCVLNGVSAIEFDVHLTIDNVIVVVHDENVGNYPISEMTFDELHQFQPAIPTLKQALNSIGECSQRYKLSVPILNIEIKPWGITNNLGIFIKLYLESQFIFKLSDFVFTSFLHTQALKLRDLLPNSRIGFIYGCWPVNIVRDLVDNNVDFAVLSKSITTKKGIDLLADNGIKSWIYTVNKCSDAVILLIDCDVSGVITDKPHEMKNKIVNLI